MLEERRCFNCYFFIFVLFYSLKLCRRRAYYDPAGLLVVPASCESVASSTFENKVGDQHGIPQQNTGKKNKENDGLYFLFTAAMRRTMTCCFPVSCRPCYHV